MGAESRLGDAVAMDTGTPSQVDCIQTRYFNERILNAPAGHHARRPSYNSAAVEHDTD